MFINQRVAAPHQSAGSEVPSDSFPRGEAKGQFAEAGYVQRTAQFSNVAGGFYLPLQGAAQNRNAGQVRVNSE